MKTQAVFLAALAIAPSALAHTAWSTFYINGEDQGDGVALRMRRDFAKATFPLVDYTSNDMACNVDGETGVSRVQSVSDGSTLTFEMRSWPNDPTQMPLDRPHQGPCAVYMKKVDSAVDDTAAGDGWFKIFDHGYDASTKQWCTDILIDNHGRLSVTLPKGMQGGYYLARPEVVALHNASSGMAQFYAGCAQIFNTGSGTLVPESTVSIPGYVKAGDPNVHLNIYTDDIDNYVVPGPPVTKFVASGTATGSDAQTAQKEGLRPSDAIIENANWFGYEVPDYSNETGCWASGEKCWRQLDGCWADAPPTGNAGCKIYEKKCYGINDACTAKNFNGPPNKGQDLTPEKPSIDIGTMMATVGGGVDSSPQTAAARADAAQPSDASVESPKTMATTTAEAKPSTTDVAASSSQAPFSAVETPSLETTLISIPASENAPAPTDKPTCPKGFHCHTQYDMQYVTVTQYVTLDSQRRRSVHERRHGVVA